MESVRILGDRWQDLKMETWTMESPDPDDIRRFVERLDAATYTSVTIEIGASERHLAVGGGAGRYVVYATFDNERFWSLLSSTPGDGIVLLNAGGQIGDYSASRVVGVQQAVQASTVFARTGALDPDQEWAED